MKNRLSIIENYMLNVFWVFSFILVMSLVCFLFTLIWEAAGQVEQVEQVEQVKQVEQVEKNPIGFDGYQNWVRLSGRSDIPFETWKWMSWEQRNLAVEIGIKEHYKNK